jgi:hypothetical protein
MKTLLVLILLVLPLDANWYQRAREERTEIVYRSMCATGGWWGRSCPSERELVAWLVFEEGAALSYYDQMNMAKGIRYRFEKFPDYLKQLSAFTAFYNPDGDRDLDANDWDAIHTAPASQYVEIVNIVYADVHKVSDGRYLYWWSGQEVVTPRGKWPGPYVQTKELGYGAFYFSGIPDVRTCAISAKHCK